MLITIVGFFVTQNYFTQDIHILSDLLIFSFFEMHIKYRRFFVDDDF